MQYQDGPDILYHRRDLTDEGLVGLLTCEDPEVLEALYARARQVAQERFGNEVFLRGLVEWSNVCRNDCLYCGIRRSNAAIGRYSLSPEEILSCTETLYQAGLRTVVLQGGENPAGALQLVDTVAQIRRRWPDLAITLSLGELPFSTYAALRKAGADRYLLRHESASPAHYARLHPAGMRLEHRLDCLKELRRLGFQTGMGMMVGSPYQTVEHLVADIRLIREFAPEMIGIGPFVPQKDTPLGTFPAGSPTLTLKLYAILRLMLPDALIPATTALATLLPDGRKKGILAGANVIMPSFTPERVRDHYQLYGNKSHEALEAILNDLASIGYAASASRGDYCKHEDHV